ncbi:MAG: hypothetical protein ABIJ43_00615 [Candidatus Beckwithbacteria bacterium]|nr:hypothetical protein [Patescibacteria group bacterium]
MTNNPLPEPVIPSSVLPQSIPSLTSQASPILPRKKSFKWLTVLIILILLTSTAIFAYQYFQLKQITPQPQTTPTPLTIINPSPSLDPTADWKTYTSSKYTFKYPSEWIVDEKCTKLGHPASNPCAYSSDYHPITKKIEPGEGGIDTVTEYNIGTLLSVDLIDDITYDSVGFCSPGGPLSIYNCHEKIINGNRYVTREIGTYFYNTTVINVWLLMDNNAVVDLNFFFSKANKINDLKIFDLILSTFKFIESSEKEVIGIQTSVCCSCPTKIPPSLLNTSGWVLYEKGKNYSIYLPKICDRVDCQPCPPTL